MLNILRYDIRAGLSYILFALAAWLFYGVSGYMMGWYVFLNIFFPMLITFMIVGMETLHKGGLQLCSFPVKRAENVLAKYCSGLGLILAGAVVMYLEGTVLQLFLTANSRITLQFISLKGFLAVLCAGIIFLSLYYPLYFRFGLIPGIHVLMAGLILFAAGLFIYEYSLNGHDYAALFRMPLFAHLTGRLRNLLSEGSGSVIKTAAGGSVMGLLTVSVTLSVRIYRNKDL